MTFQVGLPQFDDDGIMKKGVIVRHLILPAHTKNSLEVLDIVKRRFGGKMEAFLVPAGTVVEVYATTLHYAPCNVNGNKFRAAVILPKGTNTEAPAPQSNTAEDKLLFARNKWLIAHEEGKVEGAFVGLKGKNLSVE